MIHYTRADFSDVRRRFYQVPSLQDLSKTVKPEAILDFLKAAALYRLLWRACDCLKHQHVLAVKMGSVADTALNHHSLTHSLTYKYQIDWKRGYSYRKTPTVVDAIGNTGYLLKS